jgi:HAD superfamily hydrolase (TIGR01509 family)
MLAEVGLATRTARPVPQRRHGWLRNPLDPHRKIRAALFDLDGTLYRQTALRACIAVEFAAAGAVGPWLAPRRWRALSAYRQAHESLREHGCPGPVPDAQLAEAARRTSLPVAEVDRHVTDWMVKRPLKYLRWCRSAGLEGLLAMLDAAGIRTGVLSDYAADAKLRALGVAGYFSVVLCSTDPEVDALKPSPRGFLRACRLWNLPPSEVLMVGDRADVDAAGAAAAGMPCVIIRRSLQRRRSGYLVLPSLKRLHHVLEPR